MAEEFLNTEQAAEYLGITPSTLQRWRSEKQPNQPPFCPFGKRILYRKSSLEKWAVAQEVDPAVNCAPSSSTVKPDSGWGLF